MKTIEDAIAYAAQAHKGQIDKAGEPYIFHPLRLMLSVSSELERMTALFHDIVEDTHVTPADLESEGYPAAVIEAVALLTHAPDEEYMSYVQRIATNPIARTVKMADLNDNMDFKRLSAPTEKDYARIEKYKKAMKILIAAG